MKKILLLGCFIVLCFVVDAQADIAKTNTKDTDIVFHAVQFEATFPGGMSAWGNYLRNNLNTDVTNNIKLPKHVKELKQNVNVSFIVDTAGNISNVKVDNASEVYPAVAKESIRVIENGPKWIPAIQDNRKVISRKIQPIMWDISAN